MTKGASLSGDKSVEALKSSAEGWGEDSDAQTFSLSGRCSEPASSSATTNYIELPAECLSQNDDWEEVEKPSHGKLC